jgi:DTW domain-containing protein YfiP
MAAGKSSDNLSRQRTRYNGALMTTATTPSRRFACSRCLRPQRTCICRWITAIPNQVSLLILQHPLEVNNAKNSARLLHLSLAQSRIEVGEKFEPQHVRALLDGMRSVLLYPETQAAPRFDPAWAMQSQPSLPLPPLPLPPLQLVLLDATWRKSRKMLHLNPALSQLPRLALSDTPPSHYAIRKAHLPDQLSTLEAACHALGMLEGDAVRYAPLIEGFDGFVAQQASYVPADAPDRQAPAAVRIERS